MGRNKSPKRPLTYRQERFIEEYLHCGVGARAALRAGYSASSARQEAHRLLSNADILEAIEIAKEEWREKARVDREELLRILVGMVTSSVDDFIDVMRDPENQENYARLGYKRFGLVCAKKGEVRTLGATERIAAINELWQRLGFDNQATSRDRLKLLNELMAVAERSKSA